MLSNKWTFSLTYLVMLVAIGFAMGLMVTPDATAHEVEVEVAGSADKIKVNPDHPKPTLSVSEAYDVSVAEGAQVNRPADQEQDPVYPIVISIDFSTLVTVVEKTDATAITAEADATASVFDITDITISAYNEDGLPVPAPTLNVLQNGAILTLGNPNNGKNAVLTIPFGALATPAVWTDIDTLYVIVPESKFLNTDPALTPEAAPHAVSVRSDVLKIEVVGADDGNAGYREPPYNATDDAVADGVPGVVSITRALGATGFASAVTGPFDIRIILTEEPAEFTAAHIVVEDENGAASGTASAPVAGSPIETLTATYAGGGYVDGATDNTMLPAATGRDDEYQQYLVTITPNAGFVGKLVISVAQFEDMGKPVSKEYVPLLRSERLDTTITAGSNEGIARLDRIMDGREVLTVESNVTADTNITAATAAYDARELIYVAISNEYTLPQKLVIPTGGYLVLVGDRVKADIADPAATTKTKLNAAQKLFNATGLGLGFPADDLDTFFRNGGSLSLVYQDITAATGSGHDESKGPTGDDATSYTAASTNAYAAGAVIINEIMWGLDGIRGKESQYIELHNTTAADIGIDFKEWAVVVGSAPAGFTVIDTVGNNPATGYWAVPGNGGVTAASVEYPTVSDLVSMSRVTGAADGTAAASWAASIRPSANLSGRRIGSPGAANLYVMPAEEEEEEEEEEEPAAAVAKADDLMITEIMVASNDGRLPQWIEIANVSGAAVSISGWSLAVDNDSADADVVGASIDLDLGDVEIGADQVALVVSKKGRNSGVDLAGVARAEGDANAGNFDADRIIDVQSQVSPTNARYSLISEMGFMLSLIPPRTGAVRTPGDVVGNLEGGWELPMEEDLRSSLIRREMGDAGALKGTDAAGWVLASDTMFGGAYRATYYGSDNDIGTPGYDAGGALPVELSGFNAARDRVTGAVVITWSTQSELNNAGFFIKRSQQTNGKFVSVNPTMIAGAGTTAEKQSYTYTDATADPNVIYYYQIEDVSLDGNRQTLTRAHRLKGHIGAAGKATTTWGELKSSRD